MYFFTFPLIAQPAESDCRGGVPAKSNMVDTFAPGLPSGDLRKKTTSSFSESTLQKLAVVVGCVAGVVFVGDIKVGIVVKAGLCGNILQGQIGIEDQIVSLGQPVFQQIVMQTRAHTFYKKPVQIMLVIAYQLSHLLVGDIPCVMLLNGPREFKWLAGE